MPQFDLHFLSPLIFWTIISFGILLFILYRFAPPPVLNVLDERKKRIQDDIEKGEKLKAELEAMKMEYQKMLAEGEATANQKVQEAIKEAKATSEDIIRETRREVEALRQKAEQGIEQEKKKAMAEVRNQVVFLSMATATKILRHSVDEDTARKLADDVIKDLGEMS